MLLNSCSESTKSRQRSVIAGRRLSSPDLAHHHQQDTINNYTSRTNLNTFSPVIVKSSSQQQQQQHSQKSQLKNAANIKQLKNDFNLGRLDGLVSSPDRCSKVRVADSNKIAAILLETNIVELQRHLLTITIQNQVSFKFWQISIKIENFFAPVDNER